MLWIMILDGYEFERENLSQELSIVYTHDRRVAVGHKEGEDYILGKSFLQSLLAYLL